MPNQLSARAVLIEVLNEHAAIYGAVELWASNEEPLWICNCCWEGKDHPAHVADMYEAAMERWRQRTAVHPDCDCPRREIGGGASWFEHSHSCPVYQRGHAQLSATDPVALTRARLLQATEQEPPS